MDRNRVCYPMSERFTAQDRMLAAQDDMCQRLKDNCQSCPGNYRETYDKASSMGLLSPTSLAQYGSGVNTPAVDARHNFDCKMPSREVRNDARFQQEVRDINAIPSRDHTGSLSQRQQTERVHLKAHVDLCQRLNANGETCPGYLTKALEKSKQGGYASEETADRYKDLNVKRNWAVHKW